MPTKKIGPLKISGPPCWDQGHNPPSMMVFEPGEYEHTCPACGHVIRFFVGARYNHQINAGAQSRILFHPPRNPGNRETRI